MLLAGHALAYDPASLVWHHHRSDLEGLRRQMFGYGSGLTAYVTKHLLDRTSRRALISRIPRGVAHMTTIARGSQKTSSAAAAVPARSLLMRELAGMASGPFLYVGRPSAGQRGRQFRRIIHRTGGALRKGRLT